MEKKTVNMQDNCPRSISRHDKAILNQVFNPELPYNDHPDEQLVPAEDDKPETEEEKESCRLEIQGVKAAEGGDVMTALDYFNEAIQVAPNRASGYNNRAQALRLKGDIPGALQDLTKAIELSSGQGKSGCQAYTQRALIRRLEGDDAGALEDFKVASSLGSEFSKTMLVQLNPYAALCNQMLSEAIGRLQRGEEDSS